MRFLNKIISFFLGIILFIPLSFANGAASKLAYREEFEGDTKRSTAAYKSVREDASIGSTYKLPLEVEFGNSSNEIATDSELIVSLKVNYVETDIFPTIVQNTQSHYLIPLEDIDNFNIQEDYLKQGLVNYHDTAYINLDLLQGTKYDLNFENLDLNITFPVEKMQLQSFDASGGPIKNVDTKLISGAYFKGVLRDRIGDDIMIKK